MKTLRRLARKYLISPVDDPRYRNGFMEGWKAGYSDGGEHDCRMFTPTAERAWQHHVFEQTGRTLDEQKVIG